MALMAVSSSARLRLTYRTGFAAIVLLQAVLASVCLYSLYRTRYAPCRVAALRAPTWLHAFEPPASLDVYTRTAWENFVGFEEDPGWRTRAEHNTTPPACVRGVLFNVAMRRGELIAVSGVPRGGRRALDANAWRRMCLYERYDHEVGTRTRLSVPLRVHSSVACSEFVEATAFVAVHWMPEHNFHTMHDIFASIVHALLELERDDHVYDESGVVLFELRTEAPRNQPRAFYSGIRHALFGSAVRDFGTELLRAADERTVCFRRLVWSPQLRPWWRCEARPCTVHPFWRQLAYSARERVRRAYNRTTNATALMTAQRVCRVALIDRSGNTTRAARAGVTRERYAALADALRVLPSVELRVVDDAHAAFRSLPALLDTFDVNVVVGVHGAGLANALFMPPGGAIVEMRGDYKPSPYYEALALDAGHDFVSIDIRNLANDAAVAATWISSTAEHVMHACASL
mmetsp:Transcript_21475/g.52437  ORF Transcript_21475/g.52437 Transcript_21475/m.52437 type:complete len:460 (+) Transcript_21475:289-1668(+)|eukprot:CAMPEP_0198346132 /NCGR_PEP_ID=MMETSP1450-20131203/77888_1 /TAXON_ID=753684 ORGANISM="Madagascaria erythrocladiodes, Strain CCMP3234" /NCGR_SAMPLE_ID=MMETSP1450 /ASSEMBLY_ACC=CAM_ASM_001115 /LENGTH=459 /DNA_ID=CAMNT_0044051537 /DNA_START=213 /DNA_END=1592 /DNA_ORIENTATION=+